MIDKINIKSELVAYLNNLRTVGDFDIVVDRLKNLTKIRSLVNYYSNAVENYDEDDKEIIELIINILQEIYNNGNIESPVPDEEYDILYEVHRSINGNEIVGASVGVKDIPTGFHKYPDLRGTLDKIHFIKNSDKPKNKKEVRKSLEEWIKSCENRLGRSLRENELEVLITPKWDGISIVFETDVTHTVERALSRGDTDSNEAVDLTKMFKGTSFDFIEEFKYYEIGIKTETVMSRDNYEKFCKDFGHVNNPRIAVSSIFRTKDLDRKYLPYITIIPLQVQNYETKEIKIPKSTLDDYPSATANLRDLDDIKEKIENIRDEVEKRFGIDIDGVVIRLTNPMVQESLGREDGKINKFEVAYKFPPEQKKTVLKNVEFSVGVFGTVTPVAIVEPVKLNGNTIDSPSLGSIDIFESLDLREGDEVIIKYNIVPYLEKDETCRKGSGKKFTTPTHCVYCNQPLVRDPVLRCVNLDCDCRKIGKIVNYVEKMKIPEISVGTITTLYKYKFLNSIEDLYKLENHEYIISQLPGFGEKSVRKMIKGINSRKKVYDYELLGSIGIPGIGRRIFKNILNIYYLTELLDIAAKNNYEKLLKIGGIQKKTAEKVIQGIRINIDLIRFLCSVLEVKREEAKDYKMIVCFTKVRDKDFENYLKSKDIGVTETFNKNIDLLITAPNVLSSKIEKARKHNIPVITIDEAYKKFDYKR